MVRQLNGSSLAESVGNVAAAVASPRTVSFSEWVAGALRTAAELCGLPTPQRPVPPVGDDHGCAQPYRALMAELER